MNKKQALSEKKPLCLHPWLFALYFILFYYDLNKHEVWFFETLLPMGMVLVSVCIFMIFFKLLSREITKAGIFVSCFVILFFSYGAILDKISAYTLGDSFFSKENGLMWVYAFFFIFLFIGIKILKGPIYGLTRYFNVVSIILIIFPFISIGAYELKAGNESLKELTSIESNTQVTGQFVTGLKPDIYYIIVDSYTSGANLKKFFLYDNSEFLSYLIKKGFYVAPNSHSNYQETSLSMPSSLSMEHINDQGMIESMELIDSHLWEMIVNNKIMRFLKPHGYRTVLIGDFGNGRDYDQHITYRKWVNPFAEYLIGKTLLKSVNLNFSDPIDTKRKATLYEFKKLGEFSKIKEPTFVYAHFMIPHAPYAFDKDGNRPHEKYYNQPGVVYPGQVAFANKKLKQFIDKVLLESDIPPIIVIQGDHGFMGESPQPSMTELVKRFGILNAYYLPNNGNKILYDSITPVNSFRVIFDHYFGANFGLLPDKSYFKFNFTESWKFISIPLPQISIRKLSDKSSLNSAWIKSLEEYVRKNPDFYDSRVVLGWNYYLQNRHKEAIEQLKKAIKINPNLVEAYTNLGVIYMELDRSQEAERLFKNALKKDRGYSFANFKLGRIYLNSDRLEEAVRHLKAGIESSQAYFQPYYDIGIAFKKLNRYQEAVKYFKRALELFPQNVQTHYQLSEVYANLKRYPEAVKHYREVILYDPLNAQAHYQLGLAYDKIRHGKRAIIELIVAQQLFKKNKDSSLVTEIEAKLNPFFAKYSYHPEDFSEVKVLIKP